jgi:hypothetical protein
MYIRITFIHWKKFQGGSINNYLHKITQDTVLEML